MPRTFVLSAWAMALTQLVHGFIPSGVEDEDAGGYTGLVVGLVYLVLSFVIVYGAHRARDWAPRLATIVGTLVAVGFVLYHAVPVKSPFSNPYPGEGATPAAYLGVAIAVAAAAWCAVEGRRLASPRPQLSAAGHHG